MKVKEVMKKIIVVEKDLSLREAAKIMSDKGIGSLVFLKKDKLVGMITERDVLENLSSLGRKISEVSRKLIVTIEDDDSLEHAAELMTEKKIKRLPVTNKNKLTGIITATDIIANVDDLNEEFYFD